MKGKKQAYEGEKEEEEEEKKREEEREREGGNGHWGESKKRLGVCAL